MDTEIMFNLLDEDQQTQVKEKVLEKMLEAIDSISLKHIREILLDVIGSQAEYMSEALYEGNTMYNVAELVGKHVEKVVSDAFGIELKDD